jgi:hypothetical protein
MSIFRDQASRGIVVVVVSGSQHTVRPLPPSCLISYSCHLRRLASSRPSTAAKLSLRLLHCTADCLAYNQLYYSPVHLAPTRLARGTTVLPSYSVCCAAYSLAPLPSLRDFGGCCVSSCFLDRGHVRRLPGGYLCNSPHRAIATQGNTRQARQGGLLGRLRHDRSVYTPYTHSPRAIGPIACLRG